MTTIDWIEVLLLGVAIVVAMVLRRKELKTIDWIVLLLSGVVITVVLALQRSHRDAAIIIAGASLFAGGGYGVALFIRTKESHWLWWTLTVWLGASLLVLVRLGYGV